VVRKVCLDSDVLFDFLKDDKKAKAIIASLEADYFVTSINIYELWGGRFKKEENVIDSLLSWLEVVDFGKKAAFIAGDLRLKLRKEGALINPRDIFIASVCIIEGLELLTFNLKHFERMKKFGLRLVKT
jgi:tRNA(fMet)-specific endonuclease VapC